MNSRTGRLRPYIAALTIYWRYLLPQLCAAETALPAAPWQPGPDRYSAVVAGEQLPTLSLYPEDGTVAVATGKSLVKSLSDDADGGKNWYFVEIYDHMCPHCWYAVPIVTDVARAFRGSEGLRMASVNCHMRINAEVCFFLEVISSAMDYPTMLMCPPKRSQPTPDEDTVRNLPDRAQELLHRLVNDEREVFMALIRCKHRYIEKVPRGKQDPFISATGIASWVTDTSGHEVLHPEALHTGADFTDRVTPDAGAPPGRPGWLGDDKPGAPGVPAWVPGQRWFDALRGFVALLRLGYRDHRHQAAVDSAWFLARAFPVKGHALADLSHRLQRAGPQSHISKFEEILADWSSASGIEELSEDGSLRDEEAYMTCNGSNCAMWTLLHVTMTAVSARGISGKPLVGDESLAAKDPQDGIVGIDEAMNFVKTFVGAFLTCHQCKEKFLRDFDDCAYNRCSITDFRGLSLWLWRVHNAVSMDASDQWRVHNAGVDRRWPMYQDCPTCWRESLAMGEHHSARRLSPAFTSNQIEEPFHPDRVFWHMVRTYIGVQRVAFELSDLNVAERDEVQAVLQREHDAAIASREASQSQHSSQQPADIVDKHAHPARRDNPNIDAGVGSDIVALVLHWARYFALVCAALLLAVFSYNGCSFSRTIKVVSSTVNRPLRSINITAVNGGLNRIEEDNEDEELVSAHMKRAPLKEDDPAAE